METIIKQVLRCFIENLTVLSKELGLPQKLREVSIPEDACASMAKDAMKQTRLLINNPREVSERMLTIYITRLVRLYETSI